MNNNFSVTFKCNDGSKRKMHLQTSSQIDSPDTQSVMQMVDENFSHFGVKRVGNIVVKADKRNC